MADERPIVLVEDDPDDAELTIRALQRAQVGNPVVHLRDGVEALDWLYGRGAWAGRDPADVPALLLLDLKLPRVSGLEVLLEARKDPRLRAYPIVVLTSSEEPDDLRAAYDAGVNSYIRKPVAFGDFAAAVAQLGLYWLVLNRAPERSDLP